MHFLRRVWEDIRQGENIDLYVTVTIAILLAILSLIGISPTAWMAPITLAVLALLAVSVLGNRYRLERIIQQMTQSVEELFLEDYPESYRIDVTNSNELWLVGVNLLRTVATYYAVLEQKLEQGHIIRVLLVDPDGTANALTSFRSYRTFDPEQNRQTILGTLSDLCELKQIATDSLEVRVLDYPLAFGATVINPNSASGVIYLEHYAFKMPGDIPKMILRPKEGYWYEYFKSQILVLWQNAHNWECSPSVPTS